MAEHHLGRTGTKWPADAPFQRHRRPRKGFFSSLLDQEPELTRDIAHGPGIRYRLGEHQALAVELFPPHAERTTGIVRFGTSDSRQEFYRQGSPAIREEGIVFETEHQLISLSPSGELLTHRLEATQTPQELMYEPMVDGWTENPVADESPVSGDPEASVGTLSQPLATEPAPDEEPTYIQRLTGRLGRDPRFHQTRKGQLVGEFPLGVKQTDDEGTASWFNMAVFGERAAKLQASGVKQGDLIEVIGSYRNETQITDKRGRKRTKVEWRPTVVKPR